MNREQWLTELAKRCEEFFSGFTLSPYRITCGWPCKGGLSPKRRVIGECHGAESSSSGVFELFISPTIDESLQVAGVVCHEMAHIVAGIKAQHGRGFVKVAKHIGLTKGKPTEAAPGPFLEDRLWKLIEIQGKYPHEAITGVRKKLIRARSSVGMVCSSCGCKITISLKWLAEAGSPVCNCGTKFSLKDEEEGGGDE